MKKLLFTAFKGKLTNLGFAAVLGDLLINTPKYVKVFETASGADLSIATVIGAAGILWGLFRKGTDLYKAA